MIASDHAVDVAYAYNPDGSWLGLNPTAGENPPGDDNGGTGFGPWDFAGGYHLPAVSPYGRLNHFIDGLDFGPSAFNDLGSPAFGLTNGQATGYLTASATRSFANPMLVGDTFSFDFDSPAKLDARDNTQYPFVIFTLRDAEGAATLTAQAGASPQGALYSWEILDANGKATTGISPTDTSDGASFAFALTSSGVGSVVLDGQAFGVDLKAGVPASVQFTLTGNTSGDGIVSPTGERELFFTNLAIESSTSAPPGDFNGDGLVDIADYTTWRNNLGGPDDALAAGSADSGSEVVDIGDYELWTNNFGGVAAATAESGLHAVPEPATWDVFSCGVVAIVLGAKGRR
ncbi:hypothetical protein NG895_12500 [Aeoliella sp. ICT_H6.2]|uniref:PEP-CTERM protein-sorting domain-containing protein n=1 Tax=Aeoliella straminimaris TaxID=2954799 RepID=A0A9X2JJ84_9BACT|nr:hypothetical protein [Aeoliella straminimaris]MCO6044729.1 hypothetical protein [Aeoliella straminimaris]